MEIEGDLLFTLDYEILEICATRQISKLDFDELPYEIKVEMVAHWEIQQEIEEYYRQKTEAEMKKQERRYR